MRIVLIRNQRIIDEALLLNENEITFVPQKRTCEEYVNEEDGWFDDGLKIQISIIDTYE